MNYHNTWLCRETSQVAIFSLFPRMVSRIAFRDFTLRNSRSNKRASLSSLRKIDTTRAWMKAKLDFPVSEYQPITRDVWRVRVACALLSLPRFCVSSLRSSFSIYSDATPRVRPESLDDLHPQQKGESHARVFSQVRRPMSQARRRDKFSSRPLRGLRVAIEGRSRNWYPRARS